MKLTGIAKTKFDRIWDALTEQGTYIRLPDRENLESWCVEMALYESCMKTVAEQGAVVTMQNGKQTVERVNPFYRAAQIALKSARAAERSMSTSLRQLVVDEAGEVGAQMDVLADYWSEAG